MKLTKPKVIKDGNTPMTTTEKVKAWLTTVIGVLVAGALYIVIGMAIIFAVGFAICSTMLNNGGFH